MAESYIEVGNTGKNLNSRTLTTSQGEVHNEVVDVAKIGSGELTNDAWGLPKFSLPLSLSHGLWTFDIPATTWFMYENGTQVYTSTNIVSSNSAAQLTADSTNTTVLMEGRECPRYQPNRGHLFSTALWCPNKTNDGNRDWGMFTAENGVCFRLKSDGLLYAVQTSGGSDTYEQLIDTSLVSGFDVEKGNVYDIQYQWRGVGNYKFFINLVEVHAFDHLGTLTSLSMENPALPAAFKCVRTTEDTVMNIGCVDVTSEAGQHDFEQYGSAYAEAVSISTNTPVIVIHNPLQISSQTNTRTTSLARISFTCSKKGVFKVWRTRDPADITGEDLKTIGNGSYMQTDSTDMDATATRATSVTVANLQFVTAVPVEAQKTREVVNPDPNRIVYNLVRGDYLVITGTAATATAEVVIEWGEQV